MLSGDQDARSASVNTGHKVLHDKSDGFYILQGQIRYIDYKVLDQVHLFLLCNPINKINTYKRLSGLKTV